MTAKVGRSYQSIELVKIYLPREFRPASPLGSWSDGVRKPFFDISLRFQVKFSPSRHPTPAHESEASRPHIWPKRAPHQGLSSVAIPAFQSTGVPLEGSTMSFWSFSHFFFSTALLVDGKGGRPTRAPAPQERERVRRFDGGGLSTSGRSGRAAGVYQISMARKNRDQTLLSHGSHPRRPPISTDSDSPHLITPFQGPRALRHCRFAEVEIQKSPLPHFVTILSQIWVTHTFHHVPPPSTGKVPKFLVPQVARLQLPLISRETHPQLHSSSLVPQVGVYSPTVPSQISLRKIPLHPSWI